jgi:hypothetical protein
MIRFLVPGKEITVCQSVVRQRRVGHGAVIMSSVAADYPVEKSTGLCDRCWQKGSAHGTLASSGSIGDFAFHTNEYFTLSLPREQPSMRASLNRKSFCGCWPVQCEFHDWIPCLDSLCLKIPLTERHQSERAAQRGALHPLHFVQC